MKLENVVVGMKVKVKHKQKERSCPFWREYLGREGCVVEIIDSNVYVEFASEDIDFGHHANLKRVKC